MNSLIKLEEMVELYFSKEYSLYKSKDAHGEKIEINFIFESRAKFLEKYLDYYHNLNNLKSAIIDGCKAQFEILYLGNIYSLKHTHQEEFVDNEGHVRGVNNNVLSEMALKLVFKQKQIATAQSFDDVYQIIKSSKIHGFGELSIYDTAVRISAFLRLQPTKVFLHAGTTEGVKILEHKNLLPENSSQAKTLQLNNFPEPLQRLNALQMENFLCSFKKDFADI